MAIFRRIPLRMRNIPNKLCTENQNTHFMLSDFFSENRAVYDDVEKYGGTRETVNKMASERWHVG
jgi:hypothetical protein